MFKYGFELEGFYTQLGQPIVPPKNYPTDGFPGLCEVRTVGGQDLDRAYFDLLLEYSKYNFDTMINRHVFTASERQILKSRQSGKEPYTITNVYGTKPKLLGDKTLASFQINVSFMKSETYTSYSRTGATHHPRVYNLFDFVPIVKALDVEFKNEIKDSARQPGFYSIKEGVRLEYRSLPNSVFKTDPADIRILLERIDKAVNNG